MKQTLVRYFLGASFALFLAVPTGAEAAALYIDPPSSSLHRGDAITMAVRLDTDESVGECVNAVDAVITYSDSVEPVDVSIGESIFAIWVERPVINTAARQITFAGGIPNGYCGRVAGDPKLTNVLAEIVFRSPGFVIGGGEVDRSKATVSFTAATTVYLNDGQGTKAELETYPANITLHDSVGNTLQNDWRNKVAADDLPPEAFTIELVKPGAESAGQYYIVFNTTDKQTGIEQYQVMEEPLSQFGSFQWGRADAPWQIAKSPHILSDQSLNSIIRVRALDKAGNEYIAHMIPDESLRTLSQVKLLLQIGLAVGGLVVLVLLGLVWRYWRRQSSWRTGEHKGDESDVNNLYQDDKQ
jgi:hypothetical protein